ncbi:hypothetical protein IPV08_23485 [Methylobacterium sp. SD274]|uniref:hypothetical protein n=1 Tax=Methylobacterium sp. SD274 TaxID=2782009 RepID=UPI001A961466|nr:hypothetical protein [Methylobacterium sp. SD274]MBO1022924.1 hypothetical protein [Methylobacterium sp. SD274]
MTPPADPALVTAPEPVPAPMPPAAPDPVAELIATVTAMRAEIEALKTTPPAPVVVPTTDQGKPTVTPITIDFSSLPPVARMAAGYRK